LLSDSDDELPTSAIKDKLVQCVQAVIQRLEESSESEYKRKSKSGSDDQAKETRNSSECNSLHFFDRNNDLYRLQLQWNWTNQLHRTMLSLKHLQ